MTFKCPLTRAMAYDDHGPGKVLAPSYIAPVASGHSYEDFILRHPLLKEAAFAARSALFCQTIQRLYQHLSSLTLRHSDSTDSHQ
jgi:hypothetical protein